MEHTGEQTKDTMPGDEPACCPESTGPTGFTKAMGSTRVTIEPPVTDWARALWQTKPAEARKQLGFSPDRPIVMSGHQPIVFHCGILAKLIALDEASKRFDAQALWIVPDMDAVNPGQIRVPVGRGDSLGAKIVELFPTHEMPKGMAGASHRAMEIPRGTHEALGELIEWLDQFASLDSLAQQFGYGVIEYACERLGIETPSILFASQLMSLPAVEGMIETMRSDPMRCVRAYNAAVLKHPHAGVRALEIEGGVVELPLWGCRVGEPRVAIDTDNIDSFAPDERLPRGLLMSGIARLYLTDLFIHGTGGYIYDRITEEWFREWLGEDISAMAMVTATHRLELGFTDKELETTPPPDRAKWLMHHARHTPGMLGESKMQAKKEQLVAQIAGYPPKSIERASAYRALGAFLDTYRTGHQDGLKEFADQVDQALASAHAHELARDRTWAFVLFGQESLNVLDRATRKAMG